MNKEIKIEAVGAHPIKKRQFDKPGATDKGALRLTNGKSIPAVVKKSDALKETLLKMTRISTRPSVGFSHGHLIAKRK